MSIYAVNGKEPVAAWIPSRDTAGNGTTALTDLVGSNNGTLTNMDAATDWVADTDAGGVRALDLDGSNDHIVVPNSAALQFGSASGDSAFSISFWAKWATINGADFIGKNDASATVREWRIILNGAANVFVFALYSTNAVNRIEASCATIATGQWVHVCCAYSGTRNESGLNIYFDGVLQTVTRATVGDYASSGIVNAANPIWIGRVINIYTALRTDDIRVFRSELALADVSYLYAGGFGRGITAGGGIIPILRQHYAAQGAR